MRKSYILIGLAMVAALTMVSCKNNKKAQSQEAATKEIQQKQALSDSLIAVIDQLAESYWDANGKSFRFQTMELTDAEKKVTPDYLLDASVANTLVSRLKKINALGIYVADIGLCKSYGMPYDDLKEAAIKLAAELSVPFDMDCSTGDGAISEKIKATYTACKNSGEISLFWIFENAIITELNYILAHNPELFFSKITEEQWQMFNIFKQVRRDAISELAKYDEEMALLVEARGKTRITTSDKELNDKNQSIESAKQYHIAKKEKYISKRNALLQ